MTDMDLYERGARVVSVFGPFASKVLVVMSTDLAGDVFGDLGDLAAARRTDLVDAVERDLDALAGDLGESSLAAAALAMAYEVEHPFNSATSKSMCVRALAEVMEKLRGLAPEEERGDELDDLIARHTD